MAELTQKSGVLRCCSLPARGRVCGKVRASAVRGWAVGRQLQAEAAQLAWLESVGLSNSFLGILQQKGWVAQVRDVI